MAVGAEPVPLTDLAEVGSVILTVWLLLSTAAITNDPLNAKALPQFMQPVLAFGLLLLFPLQPVGKLILMELEDTLNTVRKPLTTVLLFPVTPLIVTVSPTLIPDVFDKLTSILLLVCKLENELIDLPGVASKLPLIEIFCPAV